jgi:hypothetical protein
LSGRSSSQRSSDSNCKGDSHHSYLAYQENKRRTVFSFLEKNPLLTPSNLAKLIGIPTTERKKELGYLKKLKHDWKGNHEKQRGSNRSIPDEVHNVFYKGTLPLVIVNGIIPKIRSLTYGPSGADFITGAWVPTESKNHFLLYRSRLGRIRLFSTGTVELFVRKPASDGKCMQLFCDALTKTNLIDSIKIVEEFQKGLMRRFHATIDTGQRVPYAKITAFQETHGFTMVSGDRSHPTCFEFMFDYNTEVQSAREMVKQFLRSLQDSNGSAVARELNREADYSR